MRILACLLLLVSGSAHAEPAAGAVQPGKWTYTMKTHVAGVPFPLGAVRQTLCLSPEEARYGLVRVQDDQKGACRYENWRRTGTVTRYDMVCPDNAAVSGRFEYTVSGDTLTGSGVIKADTSEITLQWQGTRVGDC